MLKSLDYCLSLHVDLYFKTSKIRSFFFPCYNVINLLSSLLVLCIVFLILNKFHKSPNFPSFETSQKDFFKSLDVNSSRSIFPMSIPELNQSNLILMVVLYVFIVNSVESSLAKKSSSMLSYDCSSISRLDQSYFSFPFSLGSHFFLA